MHLWENLFTKLKKIYFYLVAWSGVAVVVVAWAVVVGGSESVPLECERVRMGDLKTIMYIVIVIWHVYNYLTNQYSNNNYQQVKTCSQS